MGEYNLLHYIVNHHSGSRAAGHFSVLVPTHAVGNHKDTQRKFALAVCQDCRQRENRIFIMVALTPNRLGRPDNQLGRA